MAKEAGEGRSSAGVTCPNCGEVAPGLYSNQCYGVLHCGCFYEKEASAVDSHVSSTCSDNNRGDWDE